MSDNVKGFTFTWEIENFSMLPHQRDEELDSNTFVADQWENVKWRLSLYPRGVLNSEDYISLYLYTTTNVKITYYIAIVSTEPSSDIIELAENQAIEEGDCNGYSKFTSLSNIYAKKELYLPNDTLTLRCCLRPADECTEETELHDESESVLNFLRSCNSRTGIQVNRRAITLPVRNIKELGKCPDSTSFVLETALEKSPGLETTLYFTQLTIEGFVKIEICQTSLPCNNERIFVKCKMTVVSSLKKYQDSKESTHLFELSLDDIWHFPEFLVTSNLTCDKYLYLDDTLLLQCEFAFSYKSTVYHWETNYMPLTVEAKENPSVSKLVTHLEELYLGGTFCDVYLKAGDETFPAHKVVLCAMSPVFRAMFEKDMNEKESSVVEIEDVDPDTLRRMLAYMHSDALKEDLSFENACKLFCAADKYDIVTLKRRCSFVLISSLSVSNVCDVLVLAEARQDNFLLTAVRNFISNRANETFHSKHWKRFMDLNPKLSGEIMHQMCLQMRLF